MRKLMYSVRRADGTTFETASYFETISENCEVIKTYLVPIDERTENEKARAEVHRKKWREHRNLERKSVNVPC